jgi:hypothetical protein
MKSVFISYDHGDQNHLNSIKSLRLNSNNAIEFIDRSLKEPVLNSYGDINRRLPSDPASLPVRREIEKLLNLSSKLLVLVGRDTHSSEWVDWEVENYKRTKSNESILFMRVPNNSSSGFSSNKKSVNVTDWDSVKLSDWLCR